MPIVDMPIEDLKKYKGINPIPKDFDLFWKNRKEEANKTILNYKITINEIAKFKACTYYDLWFDGIDGDRVYAKYIRPNIEEEVPVILQFHGYPGASRGFFEQSSFVGMGFAIIAMDCPMQGGQGFSNGTFLGSTVAGHIIMGIEGNPQDMYYVRLFQNTIILCNIVRSLKGIDKNKIFANGASQGGAIALVCTALNQDITRCAALYPFLSDYKRVWEMDLDQIAYEGIRYHSKWFDPRQISQNEFFTKLGYIDVKNFAPMIKAKILFGTGLIDNICPASTQFAVYNNMDTKKKHVIFPDYTHEEISMFDDMLINFFLDEEE
ncbi:MAG: acetylxylan esterase [Sarcina sp.]